MSDIFTSDDNQNKEVQPLTFEQLKQKYKDEEEIAKSWNHSQKHIKDLEASLELARQEVASQKTTDEKLKEVLDALKAKTEAEPNKNQQETPEGGEGKVITEADVKGLSAEDVAEMLKQHEQSKSFENNVKDVTNTLKKFVGSDDDRVQTYLKEKAQELGVSVKDLGIMAGENPNLFYKAVGIDPNTKPKADQRPTSYTGPTDRKPDPDRLETMEDFQALRKQNINKYLSPAVQKKLLKVYSQSRQG